MLWRRAFRSDRPILVIAIFFGLLFVAFDAVLDYWFFYEGTFWELLITNVPPHEIYIRSSIFVGFIVFGAIAAALAAKHRRAEMAHVESTRALATLLRNLPGIAYRCLNDPDWTMVFLSQGTKGLTGYESSDLLGNKQRSYGDLIHPEDREAVWNAVQEGMASGSPFELTYRIVTKSGEEKWVWEQGRQVSTTESGTGILEGFITDVTARIAAEEALRTQTERNERLLDTTMDGYVLADTEGWLVDVNPAYCRMVGYERDELLAMRIHDLEAQLDKEQIGQRIEQMVQNDSTRFETRHRAKDGGIVELEISITIMPSPDRTLVAAFTRDITARKQVEQALRDSEERYRLLVENQTDMLVRWDCEGQLTFVSPSVCRTHGETEEEILGGDFMRFIHEDDRDKVRQAVDRVYQPPYVSHVEERVLTVDGWRWQSWINTAVRDEAGRVIAVVAAGRDITEQKDAEAALRASEERFRTVFEQAAVGVALMETATGRFVKVNQKFCDMLGYAASEMTDTTFQAITHPDDLQEDLDNMRRLVAGEIQEFSMEKRYYRKDGSVIWVNLTVSATWIPGNEPSFHIAIVQDISVQKRTEDDLRARDAELAHVTRLSTLGEMVASIAHEIRQPLSAIGNYAAGCQRRLTQNSGEDGGIAQAIQQISEQVGMADSIVRRYRAFADPREFHRVPIDVNQLLKQCVELLEFELRSRGISARQEFTTPPPTLVGDFTQISQVVVNLVRNACEAMRDTPADHREIVLRTENVGKDVQISVEDRGHGLPLERYNELLKPFVTTKLDGMGMGLAISSRIIEAHQGRLWATTNPTTGATFHFSLPRVESVSNEGVAF